jgi:hypothetical protein
MNTAVPPLPSESVEPKMSEMGRLLNVFGAPSKTFADIRRNASWWAPWLIGALFFSAVFYVYNQKADLDQVIRDQIAQSSRAQMFDNLSKEQQEQQMAIAIKVQKIVPFFAPVLSLITGLIAAAILMFAFNFIHEAEVSYGRSLAIFFYGGLPLVATAVLSLISITLAGDLEARNMRNLVATNPAYFMDFHTPAKFLYGMAASLDVVTLWSVILMGIGFKVNSASSKLSTGGAIATVFVLYMIWRVGISALGQV